MDDKDLKQIEELFDKSFEKNFQKGFQSIWEHNLEPTLNEINQNQSVMQIKLDKALYSETERITKLENEMRTVKEKLGIK